MRLLFCDSEKNENSLPKSLCMVLEKVFFKLSLGIADEKCLKKEEKYKVHQNKSKKSKKSF